MKEIYIITCNSIVNFAFSSKRKALKQWDILKKEINDGSPFINQKGCKTKDCVVVGLRGLCFDVVNEKGQLINERYLLQHITMNNGYKL